MCVTHILNEHQSLSFSADCAHVILTDDRKFPSCRTGLRTIGLTWRNCIYVTLFLSIKCILIDYLITLVSVCLCVCACVCPLIGCRTITSAILYQFSPNFARHLEIWAARPLLFLRQTGSRLPILEVCKFRFRHILAVSRLWWPDFCPGSSQKHELS